MKIFSGMIFKNYFYVLVALILLLGGGLRIYRYWYFPIYGETADEWAWVWLGSSLWQTGQPTSWSYFADYQAENIFEKNEKGAPLVRPALDHPPLFGLFSGITHSITNQWRNPPSVKVIRLPMVLLGMVNLGLFFILSRQIFPKQPLLQLVSLLLYATIPHVVFSSRLVVAENLLITWQLLLLILLTKHQVAPKFLSWALLTLATLAIMTKISGAVLPISVVIYGFLSQKIKLVKVGAIGLILGILCLFIYASFFDFGLFWQVQTAQAGRELGLATLHNRFFLHPTLVRDLFVDGWSILGLLALIITSVTTKANKTLQPALVIGTLWLLFIVTSSGERTYHGWYHYPLLPIFVLAIAQIIKNVWQEKQYLFLALVWLFCLPVIRLVMIHGLDIRNIDDNLVRLIAGVGFLPMMFSLLKQKSLTNLTMIGLVLGLLVANVVTVVSVDQTQYWLDQPYFNDAY